MFKSASVTQFDNPTFPSTSYTTLGTGFYDSKAPFESRSKKNGVKFGLETDKESKPIFIH